MGLQELYMTEQPNHHHHLSAWLCLVLVVAFRVFSCGTWDLVPRPGIKPGAPALGALTTGPPGQSLFVALLIQGLASTPLFLSLMVMVWAKLCSSPVPTKDPLAHSPSRCNKLTLIRCLGAGSGQGVYVAARQPVSLYAPALWSPAILSCPHPSRLAGSHLFPTLLWFAFSHLPRQKPTCPSHCLLQSDSCPALRLSILPQGLYLPVFSNRQRNSGTRPHDHGQL